MATPLIFKIAWIHSVSMNIVSYVWVNYIHVGILLSISATQHVYYLKLRYEVKHTFFVFEVLLSLNFM
jgi:hypothetical protein